MNEPSTRELAVAFLTEAGESANAYRLDPGRPVQGYCLIKGDGQETRVLLFLENAGTLTHRSALDSFYYEGWLVTGGLPVSLGSFNAGLAGEASLVCARPADTLVLDAITGIRVTGEPFGGSLLGHTTLLEGSPIWLAGPNPRSAAPPIGAEAEATPQPQTETQTTPWPWLEAEAAPQPAPAFVLGNPPPEPDSLAARETEPAQPAPAAAPAETATLPEPTAPPDPGIIRMEELHLEPAPMPVQPAVPAALNVPLSSRHPMAPRATGHAVLQKRAGELVLTIRGLPSPPSLGREASTDRPFNAYRVWLVQQRTGTKHSLGHLTRVWGDNFRFESEPGYPLSRYDAIIITADDRSLPAPNGNAPQVMGGTYIFG